MTKFRSSITGEWITEEEAIANPETTQAVNDDDEDDDAGPDC